MKPARETPLRVLFVSIAFPPKFDSEALQVDKLLEGLLDQDELNISAVTSCRLSTANMPYSSALGDYSERLEHYLEVPIRENRLVRGLRGRMGLLNFPDAKSQFASRSNRSRIRDWGKFDVIYSRGLPASSHLFAYKIAKQSQAPWVMHLSDPWSLNPFINNSFIERRYNEKFEAECFRVARLVSFTTPETLEMYAEKFLESRSKFFVSPNMVRNAKVSQRNGEIEPSNTLTVVHTGVLNNDRDPRRFLEAVRQVNRDPELQGSAVKVEMCGQMDRYVASLVQDFDDVCTHHGVIQDQHAFDALLRRADLMLAIDMKVDDPKKDVFLISKLLDYAAKRSKILALTNPRSPAAEFLHHVGGVVADRRDVVQISNIVKNLLIAKRRGDSAAFATRAIPERYLASNVAKSLKNELLKAKLSAYNE